MLKVHSLRLPTPFASSFCTSSSFPDKAAWCNFCNLVPLIACWNEKKIDIKTFKIKPKRNALWCCLVQRAYEIQIPWKNGQFQNLSSDHKKMVSVCTRHCFKQRNFKLTKWTITAGIVTMISHEVHFKHACALLGLLPSPSYLMQR